MVLGPVQARWMTGTTATTVNLALIVDRGSRRRQAYIQSVAEASQEDEAPRIADDEDGQT